MSNSQEEKENTKEPGIPGAWVVIAKRTKYPRDLNSWLVLCERLGNPDIQQHSKYVTWNYNSDPEKLSEYPESTCTDGNYFREFESAWEDFKTRA